jgi:3-hydroxybutyryl-CoA dehydrogenase
VGAGAMGIGIARAAALAGIEVALYDINGTVLRQAIERIKAKLAQEVKGGGVSGERAAETLERIHPRTRLPELGHSEIVVESVIEDLRIKKDLFRHLEVDTKPTSILASTTSSLSITAIASSTHHPEKVVGLHFLNSPDSVKLVEIIRTEETSPETLERCIEFAKQIRKTPIVALDSPGFIVNRVAQPFYAEALRILGERIADIEQIDRIVKIEGGFAAGPFELMDQVGVDVALAVTQSLYDRFCGEPRFRPHPIQVRMVESGMLGQKSGRGFYRHNQSS